MTKLGKESIWLGDTPVATLRPNGSSVSVFYVHTDHLNTPRRISRPSDNVIVWRWDADPFGTSAANEDPDGDSALFVYNLRFPGQHYDAETGLLYNWNRYYAAEVGRYIQSDPIGLRGGLNTYTYVLGNPISFVDPLGLKTTVTVRCIARQHGGSSGGVHCEVVAFCDLTGERIAFGIGGGGNGIWERLFGGKEPPKYRNPNQPPTPPTGVGQYSATCGSESDCSCQIMTCFQRGYLNNTPPPYYALTQNSNSYAHFILNQCGCSTNEQPSGAVAW